MTSEEFKDLTEGDLVTVIGEDNDINYEVLKVDLRMGRVEMQRVSYSIDVTGFDDESYNSEEAAYEAIEKILANWDDDEDDPEGSEDKKWELECADVERITIGKVFWMDYRNIEYSEDD